MSKRQRRNRQQLTPQRGHTGQRPLRRTLLGTGLLWWEWLWLGAIYGSLILAMSFLGATLRPYRLSAHLYQGPTLIYASDGTLLARFFDEYRVPVALDQVPETTIYAVLAAEDVRFFRHHGLDARGIARALVHDIRTRRLDQGGSTITQQLVRYELLDNRRSLRRKTHEAVLAVRIERTYTKQQILERYLNAIYFGGGAYGIGAAAQSYFRKPVSALTPAESALLAGLIRAPGEGNPRMNFDAAQRRQRQVLAAMRKQGWLTASQYEQAQQEKLTLSARPQQRWIAPYVVESVRRSLLQQFGRETVYRGGMVVYTTIDSPMQEAAERALARAVRAGRGRQVGNGALVSVEPATGYIRAMVGGVNFQQSQFNRAVQAKRQPGSTFKVFVYHAALEAGHALSDIELDAPITIGHWSPRNYGNSYRGYVTLETALSQSLNSVAVRLTAEMSPYAVIAAAHNAGIGSTLQPNLTVALGSSEVTPLEMARAFATYANDGVYVEPSIIKEIRYQGRVLFRHTPLPQKRVKAETAFLLTQGLRSVITSGTGRRAQIGRPAAGKTGTSSDFRDAWFVGYTPQLSTAVWLGNDDRQPMPGVAGGTLPAQAWAEYMRAALRGKPVKDFRQPSGITRVRVCSVSGKLALPSCPATRDIYVDAQHLPAETCRLHYWVEVAVCSISGHLPNATCAPVAASYPYSATPTAVCSLDHRYNVAPAPPAEPQAAPLPRSRPPAPTAGPAPPRNTPPRSAAPRRAPPVQDDAPPPPSQIEIPAAEKNHEAAPGSDTARERAADHATPSVPEADEEKTPESPLRLAPSWRSVSEWFARFFNPFR